MITYNDAVNINKCIISGRNRELLYDNSKRYNINGTALNTLKDVWYNILPEKVRSKFDYDCQEWIDLYWDNTNITMPK